MKLLRMFLLGSALAAFPIHPAAAQEPGETAFRALFKEMVEIDSSPESGSCTPVIEALVARMKQTGYPAENLHVFIPPEDPRAAALVAIYPGREPKLPAVLLLGHVDVVNARRADWTRDPYKLVEEDGYFYARGVADMKAQNAIWADSLLRYHAEAYRPRRTIKMALTCGEEGGGLLNGARWLVENQRALIDAGFALNEGGYGEFDASGTKRLNQTFQAAQKISMSFTLAATNPGGHSSVPRPDNAIYSLARALNRLSAYEFPVRLIDANKGYFSRMAPLIGGEVGAAMAAIVADPEDQAANDILNRSPTYHTMLRTTCVATMLSGGHAGNALPQRATANINCRVMPGTGAEEVLATLTRVIADPEIVITAGRSMTPVPPAPVTDKLLAPAQQVSSRIWPGVPVVPHLQPGASDAVTLNAAGIATYGVSGLFRDPDNNGVHGLNERIRVRSVMEGRRFLYELVKAYAEQGQ
ncbi:MULTISPECIES: M20/M25/M40 family metallo-hydrolase [unclassified Sphingobium]|uniref:M20/M25/M40 family metallo-hydrolase n=1 Tax=unclassified Sphingobium TaxID=2611147 RepID=UPI00222574B5|nr:MULTISPECIES: M20/M25/M40 family metallo-hydrolase [unclassified Sphingobium]MCW2413326.1 acetylornithine deacetylase/succinyl-diaminopimelate desuccinylase-like protein [Sphingobium sp. B8D3D]MCW2414375.1 acetylornithine deacetylase/succinyl-diaminopimelate desuccinylase-like protein [Sphingobium sp. B8D3A]